MIWEKQGLILAPQPRLGFGTTRLMVPTPFLLNESVIRLFCGFCDENHISRLGYIDVKANKPSEIIDWSPSPLLDIGDPGMFDDNGLCPTSFVEQEGKLYLYYFAFQQGVKLPFYMFSGLAISEDQGQTFKRYQRTPILDRIDTEPIMRSGPFVLKDANCFKVWYPSGNRFIEINGKKVHTYHLRYTESRDGLKWDQPSQVSLELTQPGEYGFGRPFVIKKEGWYQLFYSVRTLQRGYHLGYAESEDGIHWNRRDEEMILQGPLEAWESEMQCYSSVVTTPYGTYLFYNGNRLGKTGFGYALLKE